METTTTIDAGMLAKMFLAGAKNLENNKEMINELNVFPVPDGDTGTNMTLTIMAAAREVAALENPDMMTLAKAISSGSLRGARGNSGVILSQLFRGFTKGIREHEQLNTVILSKALVKATETAYKAVMKPKEGTILTVARGISDKAVEMSATTEDLAVFMDGIIEHAKYVLSQTPEMLPVLKQAGVVDSGGQGLLAVVKGCFDAYQGKEVELTISEPSAAKPQSGLEFQAQMDIKFGYCTEFIIMAEGSFTHKNELELKSYLEGIGDSIVVVADDGIVKVHVHTNDPGLAIQKALTYGALTNMKIDNMREEHQEKLFQMSEKTGAQAVEKKLPKPASPVAEPEREYGFIAVSIGEGMNEIFRGLGVDHLIEGGQTMNPSTEDMLNAVEKINAKTIFILPNNKNIILAANQARALIEEKNIVVIPTKTIPQGITALISFAPDATMEENEAAMTEEIKKVKTGQVTYAVRDTVIDGLEIKQGNIMGIGDKSILAVGTEVEGTTREMLDKLVDEDSELISIYYGSEVDEEIAGEFAAEIEKAYPDCDVEIHNGGQPIYYYVVSVE